MKTDVQRWIEANRWEIVNVSSVGTRCGRYATREDALEHAKTYDEIVRVDDDAKRVYVASRVLL